MQHSLLLLVPNRARGRKDTATGCIAPDCRRDDRQKSNGNDYARHRLDSIPVDIAFDVKAQFHEGEATSDVYASRPKEFAREES